MGKFQICGVDLKMKSDPIKEAKVAELLEKKVPYVDIQNKLKCSPTYIAKIKKRLDEQKKLIDAEHQETSESPKSSDMMDSTTHDTTHNLVDFVPEKSDEIEKNDSVDSSKDSTTHKINTTQSQKNPEFVIISPQDLESYLIKQYAIPFIVKRVEFYAYLDNHTEIPANVRYFLNRMRRERSAFTAYYEILKENQL
jgi:hypothetical protein